MSYSIVYIVGISFFLIGCLPFKLYITVSFTIFRLQDFVSLQCMDQPEDRIWHILDLQISFWLVIPWRILSTKRYQTVVGKLCRCAGKFD